MRADLLVKICGITRIDDALAAVAAGARAIGFIFWERSPRYVDPYRARAIAEALPPFVTTVGVFVDQPAAHVAGVASLVRLGAIQLHGNESPEYAASLRRPIIKAVTLANGASQPTHLAWPSAVTLLVDAHDPVRRGGTGMTIDWDGAAALAARRPIILAGGLTPANVGDAVARVQPFGIDVSSGVEDAPGIKNPARIAALFTALGARQFDHGDHHPARS
jgi:phosphoribosylanthranilate isomerase